MEKTKHDQRIKWQSKLVYITAAALVFLVTVEVVNLKARSLVVYQPQSSSQSR